MSLHRFPIRATWAGEPIACEEQVELILDLSDARAVRVRVEAPFHDDPAPVAPPGRVDRLWEHEVVELFLLGARDRYLEVELGPHGHWLGLSLEGRRNVVDDAVPIAWAVRIEGDRWAGEAHFDRAWLPAGLRAANAYAIHGEGAARRYLACTPVPGGAPDFHRLEAFAPLDARTGGA